MAIGTVERIAKSLQKFTSHGMSGCTHELMSIIIGALHFSATRTTALAISSF